MTEPQPLEIWGGVECSILCANQRTRNQLVETGHYHRLQDIDLIAETGIKTIRYPLLWDSICSQPGTYNWAWPDSRMRRLRDYNIKAIGGFIHHGSGHRKLDLLDPEFQRLFGEYAEAVARRYPSVDAFTPINEPLTTARIMGLYGVWHPYGTDESTFLRLTVAQCRAIQTAMAAIRRINPSARLMQTEDVGKTFSTPELEYQAEYDNERRWLAFDLLEGDVDPSHPFYEALLEAGVDENDLAKLAAEPCPPDWIGIDYYLTSDRFLDHRVDAYPAEARGGNGIDEYADVASVRVDLPLAETGLLARVKETWERYHRSIVFAEVHNGCTREEQLRWLMNGWGVANSARTAGIDVRAVSSWSLFGAVDWNSMLTRSEGFYESGAFDARCSPPRPTVLADAVTSLALTKSFDHPVLDRPGWWSHDKESDKARPILICGQNEVLEERCRARRLSFVGVDSIESGFAELAKPGAWAMIHLQEGRGQTKLVCEYPDGARLVVYAPRTFDSHNVVNAFLDLVVDGLRDTVTLTRADAANQYEFDLGSVQHRARLAAI